MKNPRLDQKRIVLGVSGGIAAYKAADVVRRLRDLGATVDCVMTESAARFITPLTLAALSQRPVHHTLFDPSGSSSHLELAEKADAVVVAPCTANRLSLLAAGAAGDLLTTLVLAARCPVFLVPAMHESMWTHPATQKNVETCKSFGYRLIGPARGPLASGGEGEGRLEDPLRIAQCVADSLVKHTRPHRR